MSIFDFLLGTPEQSRMDDRARAATNFILEKMMENYERGPINVPSYYAVTPETMYSGGNNLLSALGLETVARPDLPTVNIGGMDVYSSEPYQKDIEAAFAAANPSLYNELINRATASAAPASSGGGSRRGNRKNSPLGGHNRTNYAKGVVDGPGKHEKIQGYGQNDNGDIVAIGYGGGMVDPGLARAAGYKYRPDNPFDYSIGDHFNKIGKDLSNMVETVKKDVGRFFGGGR